MKTNDEIEWLNSIKGCISEEPVDEADLSLYKELLGHSSQDIDSLT